MSNPNKNKFIASLVITAGLILPLFLPAFIMMALVKLLPNEISYSGIMSLILLSIELFIIIGISTKVFSLVGLTEQKIDELGFLGLIISVLTSFIFIIAGYYWMKTLQLTSVQLSSTGILIIAVITTIILVVQVKILEKLE
ncbi:epimerase [Lysinibacillus sp. NPDC093688]|uniref:epimerase n=1 Tax=Lysinibacillus sp. NPDC093688 TaxID=3390577 RepID=UPI003D022633